MCKQNYMDRLFEPQSFKRDDEGPDLVFYSEPRLLVHLDKYAIKAVGAFFSSVLPNDGIILDLMSSWRSHFPKGLLNNKLVGLGLNGVEMQENYQLDDAIVHDINTTQALPFGEGVFDAVVLTVSVQYITRPLNIFKEVNRILKTGSKFHVIYSNRMFHTKAVSIWKSLSDEEHAGLLEAYFLNSGGWETPVMMDISPVQNFHSDPVWTVTAAKADIS